MKKISRVLSMVIVVGMIAAIPASTQVLARSGGESSEAGNLPMLVLLNRLELSEEQMEVLQDILIELLEEKEAVDALRAGFEKGMVTFNGTDEELDELLAMFREDQQALVAALRESIGTSLDEVRDLLSVNQGIVLRATLPELMGGSATGLGAPTGGQVRPSMHEDTRMDGANGSFDRDSMLSMMQERIGSGTMAERFGERMSQDLDDADIETMIRQRMGQDLDDKTIEMMREQMQGRVQRLGEHLCGAAENLGKRLGQNLGGRNFRQMSRMSGRVGNAMPECNALGQLSVRSQISENTLASRRGQSNWNGQPGERGNLFELLEQVVEVLELKLEAME